MRIVIVEDAGWMGKQVLSRAESVPDLHVVRLTAAEDDAVEMIVATHPDVVMIDLAQTTANALNVLKRIRAAGVKCAVLALSKTDKSLSQTDIALIKAGGQYYQSGDFSLLSSCLETLLEADANAEFQRIAALKSLHIMDTPEEMVFDEITRLAGAIADTPIALMSLVDENREWFKSHIGIEMREVPRAISFCQFAIKQTELFVVEDAQLDARFKDNPLVTNPPYVRFYAGMPIVLNGGQVVGTLCVVDQKPNHLSKVQRLALQVLSHNIIAELEKRVHVATLNEEIARRKEAEIRIMQFSTRDKLTDLPNRVALHQYLQQAIKLAERGSGGVAFLYIDLDRFKAVNDTLGHNVGDLLLVEVCKRMSAVLRDSDSIARMGGDEFAVVLSDVVELQDAQQIANKIIAVVSDPFVYGEHHISVGCSIGIALFPKHSEQADELIRKADLAMYQAKKQGGGVHQVFLESMQDEVEERMSLERDLSNALQGDELRVYYQPKLLSDDESLVGAEALVRWQHPRLGMLEPECFVPMAEETGQIVDLGEYVLRTALAQLVAWDQAGLHLQQMAVNVAPLQLRAGFATKVGRMLREHAIAPERLELEITETALTRDVPDMLKVLHELQALGVLIAIDDFGVGSSSLALLRNLPANTLKIDRSFVLELGRDTQDAAIIRAIVVMAQALNLRTVAEGVESHEQYLTLKSLNCDRVQGNWYSPPLAADEFLAWAIAR